nr:hypothetical protein [Tanacetum cinerariifolium]
MILFHFIHTLSKISYSSLWSSIIKECNALKSQGLDLISHCEIRVGYGMSTSFWHDQWLGDSCLRLSCPSLFVLENNKVCTVAAKMSAPFVSFLRRDVRGREESAQLSRISDLLDTVVLSNMGDRRFWDLNGDGCFRVKDVRRMLDDMLLSKYDVPSRWVKQIPIKVNVLAWKISMDRLPTRVNLHRRGVQPFHQALSLEINVRSGIERNKGSYLETHDFLQLLERVGKNVAKEGNNVEESSIGKSLPPAPPTTVEHIFPGGIGT